MARINCGINSDPYQTPFSVKPYAGYALASNLVESAKTGSAVGDDFCGGTALSKTGTPTDDGYDATTSDSAYWQTPFTATTLVDAISSQNGCTIMAVGRKAAAATLSLVTSYQLGNTSPSISLNLESTFLLRAVVQANSRVASLANDPARGDRFGIYALTLTPTALKVYEKHAGANIASASSSFSSQTIGGGGTFRIGDRYDLSSDGGDVSLVLFDALALTDAQITKRCSEIAAWMNFAAGTDIL